MSSLAVANPRVVPGLQQWQDTPGQWQLEAGQRIVIATDADATQRQLAKRFADELAGVSGLPAPAVVATAQRKPGDIALRSRDCVLPVPAPWQRAESYTLQIDTGVQVCAATTQGLFYGSRTVLQLLLVEGGSTHRRLPRGHALDYPRYRERAVMFDVGRKFADVDFLKRYLRFMGWYKLNTLHVHLNDHVLDDAETKWMDRSFRLKSDNPAFAGLIPQDGQFYTRADWDALEEVAAENGVRLVPEIDVPGHAGALVIARPDLVYTGDRPVGGTLDPRKPGTLPYVESVFAEFLPWFRNDTVHVGGDEVNLNHGDLSTQVQVDFLNQLGRFLIAKGKQVEMWASADFAGQLDTRFIQQRWIEKGEEASFDWSAHGYRWIESSGNWYVTPFHPRAFNPQGYSGQALYDGWQTRSVGEPLGGQIAQWNDYAWKDYAYEPYVHDRLKAAIPAAGQIFWRGKEHQDDGLPLPYASLLPSIARLQYGPGGKVLFGDAGL
ncbi:family 20 glycosylhydrolase [Pseudoxanthomonas sp. GM95]|uniref:family 20 glycosylhydrolase n=1 Tax=Pseudoxanthomonas sp. GM95 TaxID=1881043 RepID=UPI001587BD02|nr:family 20 glycosylhydrolase [Pseudoxanthomonas sp. GM95]